MKKQLSLFLICLFLVMGRVGAQTDISSLPLLNPNDYSSGSFDCYIAVVEEGGTTPGSTHYILDNTKRFQPKSNETRYNLGTTELTEDNRYSANLVWTVSYVKEAGGNYYYNFRLKALPTSYIAETGVVRDNEGYSANWHAFRVIASANNTLYHVGNPTDNGGKGRFWSFDYNRTTGTYQDKSEYTTMGHTTGIDDANTQKFLFYFVKYEESEAPVYATANEISLLSSAISKAQTVLDVMNQNLASVNGETGKFNQSYITELSANIAIAEEYNLTSLQADVLAMTTLLNKAEDDYLDKFNREATSGLTGWCRIKISDKYVNYSSTATALVATDDKLTDGTQYIYLTDHSSHVARYRAYFYEDLKKVYSGDQVNLRYWGAYEKIDNASNYMTIYSVGGGKYIFWNDTQWKATHLNDKNEISTTTNPKWRLEYAVFEIEPLGENEIYTAQLPEGNYAAFVEDALIEGTTISTAETDIISVNGLTFALKTNDKYLDSSLTEIANERDSHGYTNCPRPCFTLATTPSISGTTTLTDGFAFYNAAPIANASVSFSRENLVAGELSTLCLPFATTLEESVGVAYKFTGVEEGIANFQKVAGLEANTPYLVKPVGTAINIAETDATIEVSTGGNNTPQGDYEFVGTYTKINATPDVTYGIHSNQFVQAGTGVTVPAYRAYLQYVGGSLGAKSLAINNDGGATSVNGETNNQGLVIFTIDNEIGIMSDKVQTVEVYRIDGTLVREVQVNEGIQTIGNLASGIYIINNRKVVIK